MRSLSTNIGKLLLCGAVFSVGSVLGGILVAALGLRQPPMPEGMDPQLVMLALLLESPLLASVLALLARKLSGEFWARTIALLLLTWISNSVNNQLEAAAFAGMQEGFWFTVLAFLVPAVLVSASVAGLFPSTAQGMALEAIRSFYSRYPIGGWVWRIIVAALVFMPIYYLFGTLVIPITRSYYSQSMYGLQIPPLDQLLVTLLLRSILFLVACLPVLILWQGSKRGLTWRLGLALFYLVGLQSLLIANWMPWMLRLPHMVEILFDEFAYAAVLVWLLGRST